MTLTFNAQAHGYKIVNFIVDIRDAIVKFQVLQVFVPKKKIGKNSLTDHSVVDINMNEFSQDL